MPEYQEDQKGFYADTEDGKFRPLDIEDGRLIRLNSLVLMQRALNRARIINHEVRIPAKYQ